MIEANNPHIDVVALERRIQIELRQPEKISARPLVENATATALPMVSGPAMQRMKYRLRALPLIGEFLVYMNGWRRQMNAWVRNIPYLGYGFRWLKSLALIHETRVIVTMIVREQQLLHAEIAMSFARLDQNIANLDQRLTILDQRLTAAVELQDAHLNLLKSEVGNVEVRLKAAVELQDARLADLHRDIMAEKKLIAANRAEILFQQRRLTQALAGGEIRYLPGAASEVSETSAVSGALDSYYAAFEGAFRGSREEIKGRLGVYIARLNGLPRRLPVLDIGCGRGEWVELLSEHKITAYGIDLNSVFVADGRALHLDVREAEALAHLRGLDDASLAAVTGFHIIEHLELEVLISILDEANRVLAPGGIVLLETPNPENLIVGASTFWNDPTHRAPLPPSVVRFMVEHRGFIDAELIYLHPVADELHLSGADETSVRLNRLLYGPQDYAILARKA